MRPTFAGFYIARSGIQAARASLDITGQNIANISTEGYTRQRLDTTSIGGCAVGMQYADLNNLNIGQGVSSDSVSQVRDKFLDLRYRITNAKVGEESVAENAKSSLDDIFNEIPGDNGLQAQINALISALDTLNGQQGSDSAKSAETSVKGDCEQIATMFRQWSDDLETVRSNEMKYFQEDSIDQVNSLLKSIASLDTQIKESDVVGTKALELQDQRNQMLDQLSGYADIEINYNSVSVGAGRSVDELSINLLGANGNKYQILNHDKYGSFNLKQDSDGYSVEEPVILELKTTDGTNKSTDGKTAFSNSQIEGGEFKSYLMLLNDNGEYDAANKTDLLTNLDTKTARINTLLNTISTANQKVADKDSASSEYEAKRTEAIAELETYLDINVTKNTENGSILDITLNTTGDDVALTSASTVAGSFTCKKATLAVVKDPSKGYPASIKVTNDAGDTTLDETSLTTGNIKFDIYRLNADTSIAASLATEHGIGYYQKRLDTLATSFAETLNRINSTNTKSGTEDYNKPLFSNGNNSSCTTGITAANISIAKAWTDLGTYITASKDGGTTSNILYMKNQISAKVDFKTPEGTALYSGGILDYATDMATVIGKEVNSISTLNSSYTSDLDTVDTQRQSVSSVGIDDEGINLMNFSQALTASSRVMTAMDDELDVIINKMGRVGN